MQLQLCTYKPSEKAPTRMGLAKMKTGFDFYDVTVIIDLETWAPQPLVWTYDLISGTNTCIDTERE